MLLVLLVTGVPELLMHQYDTLVSLLCPFAVEVSVVGFLEVVESL